MANQITNISTFADQIYGTALQVKLWQQKVRVDRDRENGLRDFIGDEGSKSPIIRVTDLAKDAGDTVTINTVAPLGGFGVLGESAVLRENSAKLNPGAFPIVIDALRHAASWTMLFKMFARQGKNADVLTAKLLASWAAKHEEDDLQMKALKTARLIDTKNYFFVGKHADQSTLRSTDLFSLNDLSETKGVLSGLGAEEIEIKKDVSGASIPSYIYFAPDQMLASFKNNATVQQVFREADMRGGDNRLFTGKYGILDSMILYPHRIARSTAPGRQGSPLAPMAYVGTAIADGTPTVVTGGGGTGEIDNALYDYFANFPGYLWKWTSNETPTADPGPESSKHYAMIYNVTDQKYEIISYTTGGITARRLDVVTRGSTTTTGGSAGGGNVTAEAAGRFSLAHPTGSLIFPCTRNGVPLVWGLGLGANAIMHARGMYDVEPIADGEDFHLLSKGSGGQQEWWRNARGILSVRGMECYKNSFGGFQNFVVVCGARVIPGIKGPEAYLG